MNNKDLCLEEMTEKRRGERGWEGAKVENKDENKDEMGRSIEGEQMKKSMRQL